jgi:hypothetical protein
VRCWLAMRPVPWRDTESADPVNPAPAVNAVEDELLELALEVRLHVQKLKAEQLRRDRNAARSVEASRERPVCTPFPGHFGAKASLAVGQAHGRRYTARLRPPQRVGVQFRESRRRGEANGTHGDHHQARERGDPRDR